MNPTTPTDVASKPMRLCVIGAGYVGLTAAACFAHLGHEVWCVETDPGKLAALERGEVPIYEPGLSELLQSGTTAGRLEFVADVAVAIEGAQIALACVGTPPRAGGEPDLRQLAAAVVGAARAATGDLVIAVKSTVPPGTCEALELLAQDAAPSHLEVLVGSNPEFLRESQAVYDFFHPDRVVVGADDEHAGRAIAGLYPPTWPVHIYDRRSAELTKYAANTLLAVKISFANEIAGLCEQLGADARSVLHGVGLDGRIGSAFLRPGPGYGGSCLSKDVGGLLATADSVGFPMRIARAAAEANQLARERVVERLERALGSLCGARVAVLGLSFKAGTDDTRDSPAVAVVSELRRRGAEVTIYDPLATETDLAELRRRDPYAAAEAADALVVLCAWPEFGMLESQRLRELMDGALVVDAVGCIDRDDFEARGFDVLTVGRSDATHINPVIVRPLEWALDHALG